MHFHSCGVMSKSHLGSSPSQPTLLEVCVLLVECLIVLGQFDLLCCTAALPAVPVRAWVSFDLRFSPNYRCCFMSAILARKQFFRQATQTGSCSSTVGIPVRDHPVTTRSRRPLLLAIVGNIWLLVCRGIAISVPNALIFDTLKIGYKLHRCIPSASVLYKLRWHCELLPCASSM